MEQRNEYIEQRLAQVKSQWKRGDEGMGQLLIYENVAWYEDGKVRILDRRIYPTRIEFVTCTDYREVRQAISDMVTQSTGPYTAIGMAMALAAYQCKDKPMEEQLAFLRTAADELAHSRPSVVNRYMQIAMGCYEVQEQALKEGKSAIEAAFNRTVESLDRRYYRISVVAQHLVDLFPKKGRIMTQCYGETIVGCMMREARLRGLDIEAWCCETRPYLQGARLTASVIHDMGFPVTILTDNMPGHAMKTEHIDLFTSAADSIRMDGTVLNKVGTMQIAMLGSHFGVPYYVTGIPDLDKPNADGIVIEQRNPEEVLTFRGIRVAKEGIKAFYPAFDITPPEFVTGVVTDKGVFKPKDLVTYADTFTPVYY